MHFVFANVVQFHIAQISREIKEMIDITTTRRICTRVIHEVSSTAQPQLTLNKFMIENTKNAIFEKRLLITNLQQVRETPKNLIFVCLSNLLWK